MVVVWADNGDSISMQYAGTGALKSDFTRTGHRSYWGVLQDGFKSAIRYHKSNFTDGYRQDAMDLFHGRYLVRPFQPSPFKFRLSSLFSPISLLGSVLVLSYFTALLLGKSGIGKYIPRPLHLPVILTPAALLLWAVLKNGTLFVQYPQLVPLKTVGTGKTVPLTDEEGQSLLNTRKVHII